MNQQNIKTKSSLPSSDFFAHYNNSSVARRPTIAEEESIFCSICCCNVCKFDLEWQVGDRRELAAGSYSSRKKLHVVMFLCVYWFSIASFVMRFNLLISWQRAAIEFTHLKPRSFVTDICVGNNCIKTSVTLHNRCALKIAQFGTASLDDMMSGVVGQCNK